MKKNNLGSKAVKALSVVISASLMLQPVAALAEEADGSVNAALELNVSGEEVKSAVEAAEEADEAAYAAKLAAEEALMEAEKLEQGTLEEVIKADEASYQNYEDEEAAVNNSLDDEIDALVVDAIEAKEDAESKIDELRNNETEELEALVKSSELSVSGNLEDIASLADAADKAEDDADKALAETEKKAYRDEALLEAAKAQAAANVAKEAADKADDAYKKAEGAYQDALKEYERICEEADKAAADLVNALDEKEKQAALDAIDVAENKLSELKDVYDKAMADRVTAEEAASLAAEKAMEAEKNANALVDNLADVKGLDDLATLETEKTNKETALEEATAKQKAVNEESNSVIEAQTKAKNAAEVESRTQLNNFNNADKDLKEAEKAVSQADKLYNDNITAAGKNAGDVKTSVQKSVWVWDGPFWGHTKKWTEYTYYTQAEIDEAKKAVEKAEADKETALAAKQDAQTRKEAASEAKTLADQASKAAQKLIDDAKKAESAAASEVSKAQTALAEAKTTLSYITNYVYGETGESAEVMYLDKAELETFKALMNQMDSSFDQYAEIKKDTQDYADATDGYSGIVDWFLHFWGDQYTEKSLENKYRNWNWKWESGEETHWTFTTNGSNLAVLVTLRDNKLTMTEIDEAEFSVYSATFDKVAAAKAAQKAADAKEAEAAALAEYQAAVDALEAAKARVNALKVNGKTSDVTAKERAERDLVKAEERLAGAKVTLEMATSEAQKAQSEADEALKIANGKAVRPSENKEEKTEEIKKEEKTVPETKKKEVVAAGTSTDAPVVTSETVEETAEEEIEEVIIEAEEAPKADAPEIATVTVEEAESPKAPEIEEASMGWWWLLIVVVLGAAGAELYRRYQLKKNASK